MATMKIRIDENEADNLSKVKKIGAPDNTKRAALGDLQNRGVFRNIIGKDAAQKNVKEIKTEKIRVDTQWKRTVAVAANQKQNEINIVANSKGAGAVVAARKIVTRSNSVRGGLNKNGNDVLHGQNKVKTLTTKVVENKPQQVKYITKTKAKEEKASVVSSTTETTLRREDSNLSLKSLSKLRAALAREASTKPSLLNKATSAALIATAPTAVAAAPKVRSESCTGNVIKKEVKSEPIVIKQAASSDLKIVSVQTHAPELLKEVEDIDADDADNLVLVSEYVNDIYNYLYSLEVIHSIRSNHLEDQKEIYPKMRSVLIDWINEVHMQFHLVPETFQMAVAIIDRYLQNVKNTQRSQLQLVGVTALFLAAKYEELYPPALADFVYITDDTYTARQILQMEIKIIKELDFNLSRPVPLHFLRRFSKAAFADEIHHAMAKYFIELTLIDYDLASYKPSEVAAASLFLSLNLLKGNSSCDSGFNNIHWTKTLEWYSRYSAEQLRPIAKKIATIAYNAPNAKLKAVYQKFKSSSLLQISLRPELNSPLIKSIVNLKEDE